MKIRRKKDGSMTDLLGASICLLCLMVVMVCLINFSAMVDYKREINSVTRSALLLLEQQGELTKTDVNAFTTGLNGLFDGNPTIKLTVNGSPLKADGSSVKMYNGNEVSVKVEISATTEQLGLTKVWGIFKDEYAIVTELHSVSKVQKKGEETG